MSSDAPTSEATESPDPDESTSTPTETSTVTSKKQRWFPLESNPALLNAYMDKLGFQSSLFSLADVYSTEDWALQMIPQPTIAVIFLYPLTPELAKQRPGTSSVHQSSAQDLWFVKQRIGNACGTIGILHALLNSGTAFDMAVRPDSWLATFAMQTRDKSPIQRAELLEADPVIATLHDQATHDSSNQTSRGNLEDKVLTHFVAFIQHNNTLYELDGRQGGPIDHGTIPSDTNLLASACQIIQSEFMAKAAPGEMRFTILALAPKQDDFA